MCGCQAHHYRSVPCTCSCASEHHQPDEDMEAPHPWQRWLPFMAPSSDDDSMLRKDLWSAWSQDLATRSYDTRELVLITSPGAWGLGLSFESFDTYGSGGRWRGITMSVGPFHLTLSRDKGKY